VVRGRRGRAARSASPDRTLVGAHAVVQVAAPASAERPVAAPRGGGFIASPLYDTTLFILAPLLALALVVPVAASPWALRWQPLLGIAERPAVLFILVWSQAHAVAVFFRSHGNRTIFVRHRFAFVGVPVLVFTALMASDWVMVAALVLAPFWAVYHIGMQSFGLCRIYDARRGNPPDMGRHLDFWLHQLINIGPFLVGWSLLAHLESFRLFGDVGWREPAEWTRAHGSVQGILSRALILAGPLFVAYYVHSYWRLGRRGYRFSPQKIALLVTTAGVSIIAWGWLTAWKAIFVMNFFHGLQYFALVWHTEKRNMGRLTRLESVRASGPLLLVGFAAVTLLAGLVLQLYGRSYTVLRSVAALALLVSLLHYWYDGFVWSVRKREV
jgi:hypothetical protein